MQVIIPLAGFGTRLRPQTFSKPKPLINVAGKPVLAHILDKLIELDDLEDVIFIVGYLGEQIEAYVRQNYTFKSHFREQKQLLGQAHAIDLARDLIHGPILIIFVDTIFEADLSDLEEMKSDGAIFCKRVEDPRRFGVVELGKDGYVTRYIEKPETVENDLATIGLYYLQDGQRLMQAVHQLIEEDHQTKGEYYLADALQIMIDQGAKLEARTVKVWQDCGKPETVLATNRYLLDNGAGNVQEGHLNGALVIPPVYVAPTAVIERSVIGPYVTIADGCHVQDTVISDSIIDSEATVKGLVLKNSLIGRAARLCGSNKTVNVGDSSVVDWADD